MKLRGLTQDTVLSVFHRLGVSLTRRTRHSDLRKLIRELHPVDSGVELIRLGPDGDGGYLLPNDLEGVTYCFSPGVSTESGFEAALARRGLKVHLADHSVDQAGESNPEFSFRKKHVGCFDDDVTMTLDTWKADTIPNYDGDLILQMDIEGAEIETLLAASPKLLAQIRILIVEFHSLHELWQRPLFEIYTRVFRKILRTHGVVHIHPNNCCGIVGSGGLEVPRVAEFTFYRNDRFEQCSACRTFPHPLDRDNTARPTLVLPRCWYR